MITDGDTIIIVLGTLNLMINIEQKITLQLFYSSGPVIDITDQIKLNMLL